MYREKKRILMMSFVRYVFYCLSYGHNYNWGTLKILLLSLFFFPLAWYSFLLWFYFFRLLYFLKAMMILMKLLKPGSIKTKKNQIGETEAEKHRFLKQLRRWRRRWKFRPKPEEGPPRITAMKNGFHSRNGVAWYINVKPFSIMEWFYNHFS